MELMVEAYAEGLDIDVILILGAIKCGLYSRDEEAAKHCIILLYKINETLRMSNAEAANDQKFATWFTKIVKQPEDSFVHNSIL